MARAAMARADRFLAHGDLVDAPGLRLRAVWTPGHTPGHLCFHDETHGLLLTGDHVLPRITPNISAYDMESEPLKEYLESLTRTARDPAGRGAARPRVPVRRPRCAARRPAGPPRGAARRGGAILRAGTAGGQTAWQVARQVSWSRGWDELSAFQHQAALGEVVAHLRHLRSQRIVTCAAVSGVGLWQSAAGLS